MIPVRLKSSERVPAALEMAMVVAYKYAKSDGLPNKLHGCVEVRLDKRKRFVTPVKSIEGALQLIPEKEKRCGTEVFLVNNYIDLETYYYVY